MNIDVSALKKVMPRAPGDWLLELSLQLIPSGIDTRNEIASFIAQVAHESAEFTRLEENLHYSADRLMAVWPRRFISIGQATYYAGNPERLANYIYADRLGNGDRNSGDGWRFRGRGPIQLTGRANYSKCAAGIGEDVVANPDLLLTPRIGIASAIWYWHARGLDLLDDDEDVRAETLAVNGGEHGLKQRQEYFDKCAGVL